MQAFAGFGESSPGDYFEIHAADGTVLAGPLARYREPPVHRESSDQTEGVTNCALPEGVDGRAYWRRFTPADDEENRFAGLRIIVASDRGRLKRTLQPIATTIAMVGAEASS